MLSFTACCATLEADNLSDESSIVEQIDHVRVDRIDGLRCGTW
jgi:hypothetical protein